MLAGPNGFQARVVMWVGAQKRQLQGDLPNFRKERSMGGKAFVRITPGTLCIAVAQPPWQTCARALPRGLRARVVVVRWGCGEKVGRVLLSWQDYPRCSHVPIPAPQAGWCSRAASWRATSQLPSASRCWMWLRAAAAGRASSRWRRRAAAACSYAPTAPSRATTCSRGRSERWGYA